MTRTFPYALARSTSAQAFRALARLQAGLIHSGLVLALVGSFGLPERGLQSAGRARPNRLLFAGNPDQDEQGIAAGIGQRSSEPVRRCRFADRADRPVRGHPFAGGVDERGHARRRPLSAKILTIF